jgi:hypothetical protein
MMSDNMGRKDNKYNLGRFGAERVSLGLYVHIYSSIYMNSYEASRLNKVLDSIYSKMNRKTEDSYYPFLPR